MPFLSAPPRHYPYLRGEREGGRGLGRAVVKQAVRHDTAQPEEVHRDRDGDRGAREKITNTSQRGARKTSRAAEVYCPPLHGLIPARRNTHTERDTPTYRGKVHRRPHTPESAIPYSNSSIEFSHFLLVGGGRRSGRPGHDNIQNKDRQASKRKQTKRKKKGRGVYSTLSPLSIV